MFENRVPLGRLGLFGQDLIRRHPPFGQRYEVGTFF